MTPLQQYWVKINVNDASHLISIHIINIVVMMWQSVMTFYGYDKLTQLHSLAQLFNKIKTVGGRLKKPISYFPSER